jgi:hypothetical protein
MLVWDMEPRKVVLNEAFYGHVHWHAMEIFFLEIGAFHQIGEIMNCPMRTLRGTLTMNGIITRTAVHELHMDIMCDLFDQDFLP